MYHPNGTVERYVTGLEYDLLLVVLKHLKMTIFPVPTSDDFEKEKGSINNLIRDLITKKANRAVGVLGNNILYHSLFGTTNTYYITRVR